MMIATCTFCGRREHIDLLDGAPITPDDHVFEALGCIACHAEGKIPIMEGHWAPATLEFLYKSVCPELRPYYLGFIQGDMAYS
jgi:hypothetical protein